MVMKAYIRQGRRLQTDQPKQFYTVEMGTSVGLGLVDFEGGMLAVIDPETADVYIYDFGGVGPSLSFGRAVSVQVGAVSMIKPTDIKKFGLDVAAYIAGGPSGAAGQIQGNGPFGNIDNGVIGYGAGWATGAGAGIAGHFTYTWLQDKTNLIDLPKIALNKLLNYVDKNKYPFLSSKINQAIREK